MSTGRGSEKTGEGHRTEDSVAGRHPQGEAGGAPLGPWATQEWCGDRQGRTAVPRVEGRKQDRQEPRGTGARIKTEGSKARERD